MALIADIEDKSLLQAVKTILDYRKKEKFILLTSEQEQDLLKSSEHGEIGNYNDQSELDKKVKEWLEGEESLNH